MYDSYNECYELYEKFEKSPVTEIEPEGGGTGRSRIQAVHYGSTEYKVQKFFFVLLMLLAIWFGPGWVVALVRGESGSDFHIMATLVNLGVLFFLHPVQLILSALACTSDGFLRMKQDPKVTEERRRARRFAAGTAAVTAVLSARNISRMGRSLMSGKERL